MSSRHSAITAGRDRLVAADDADQAVEQVAAGDQLDRVGDHLARDQRRLHPLGAHRHAVGHRDRVELHRRPARRADAGLDALGQLALVEVARHGLDPRRRDADDRPRQVVVGEPDRLQHRPRRRRGRGRRSAPPSGAWRGRMGGRTGSPSRLRLELDVDPPRPARCEELVRVDLAGLADDVRTRAARSCSPTPSAAAADARRRRGARRAHAQPRPPRRQGPLRIPSP